jgi:DNA-binding protein H-NS
MIKADMLDAFSDEDVREVRVLADKVLKRRDDDRKDKALEQARATLAAAGLSLRDLARVKAKPNKGPSYKGGHSYQHPSNKALTWNAKGKKPKWLVEMEAQEEKPLEIMR